LFHGKIVADRVFPCDSAPTFYNTTLEKHSFYERGFPEPELPTKAKFLISLV
jgi:hypothetical protein